MSDIAIRVEGLGKMYRIAHIKQKRRTLGGTLASTFTAPLRRAANLLRGNATGAADLNEEIWALSDISFNVKYGEVVGIIGRNGAGKSTLLKTLTRITEPSTGFAEINGRVGSLLEVGTGFHPELTGRENVFLNGAILGMTRNEIRRKFDEIVAFSEVEKFIDTPVKHYSSGMTMRLAFAVAAHLEPEILIVDEVLAVGDARFQRKCLSKMEDVGQQGRTVLFVSHNMPAVTRLCPRALLLDQGRLVQDGASHYVAGVYLHAEHGTTARREYHSLATAPKGNWVRLCAVTVRDQHGEIAPAIDIRRPVAVEMEYEVTEDGHIVAPYFDFYNEEGLIVFSTADHHHPVWNKTRRAAGRYVSSVQIPGNFLAEGTLFVTVGAITKDPPVAQFEERDAVAFQVVDSMEGDSARGDWAGAWDGVVRPMLQWSTNPL